MQVLLVAFFAWVYDEIRELHGNVVVAGIDHGRDIWRIDHQIHMAWTEPLNHALDHHPTIANALATYYVVMHLGMTSLVLVILWINGRHYRHQRNVLVLLSLVGLVVYWVYPTAPPRLLGLATIHDTVCQYSQFGCRAEAKGANLYAAVPSLHMAWAVWVAVALWVLSRRWWVRVIAIAHPVLTAATVLATGNHYTVDLLSGVALTAIAYPLLALLRWCYERARRRLSPQPAG